MLARARARPTKRDISKCNAKITHSLWPLIVFTRARVLIRGQLARAISPSRRVPNTNISVQCESNYRPINARVANLLCKRKFIAYPRRAPSFVIFPAEFRAFLRAYSRAVLERDAQKYDRESARCNRKPSDENVVLVADNSRWGIWSCVLKIFHGEISPWRT